MRIFWLLLGSLCFYNIQTPGWQGRAWIGLILSGILFVWNPGGKK
jgi:hypothetical protein